MWLRSQDIMKRNFTVKSIIGAANHFKQTSFLACQNFVKYLKTSALTQYQKTCQKLEYREKPSLIYNCKQKKSFLVVVLWFFKNFKKDVQPFV